MKHAKRILRLMRSLFVVITNRFIIAKNWLYLKTIPKSNQTIIIGPWLSEVGFEVLYWIPFLKWLIENRRFDNNKIIVVSRGGTKLWYGGIADKYVDILDFYSPQELKERNEKRIKKTSLQKQTSITDFDREILEKVKDKYHLGKTYLIHPSMMYNLFSRYWYGKPATNIINRYAKYCSFSKSFEKPNGLPDNYIAMKFYFSDSFPKSIENIDFINKLVKLLSKTDNIVVLNTNLQIDDHSESSHKGQKIFTINNLIKPQNNLEIQTKVIAHAKAFFGTYGGFSYLAPFFDIPSYSFYSDEKSFNCRHLDAADNAYHQIEKKTGKKLNFNVLKVSSFSNLLNIIKGI